MASTTSKIKMISRIKRGAHAPRFHWRFSDNKPPAMLVRIESFKE